jgi:hypothetical protein
MSRLRADSLVNYSGSGSPNFKSGVTGAAITFSGDITAANGSFTGNVTIGGTLSYQDVTNIDSVGIITAQQGIQVSANGVTVSGVGTFNSPITVAGIATINGGGLDVTGVITATSFTGDGSTLSGVSPSVSGIASGTLANGQTVILHSDGKVGAVATTGTSQVVGSGVTFESAETAHTSQAYDSGNNRVVIAYTDYGNSRYGTAVVGTITGTAVTFGTPVVFKSGTTFNTAMAYDANAGKIVIAFEDSSDTSGKAVVGTVSGDTITFGSEVTYNSDAVNEQAAVYDSNSQKVVIAYKDKGNSNYGTAIVGTVSGTSISFGSETVFESANTTDTEMTFDSSNNKVVIAYRDNGNSNYGTAVVGTVSGTSISFGTPVVYESATIEYNGIAFDSSNNKVVIAYADGGNSNYGTAIVGTVSGTSISFGSATVYESAQAQKTGATFDSNAGKVVISYEDGGDSDKSKLVVGTVSGTSISFESPVVFESSGSYGHFRNVFDSTENKVFISMRSSSAAQGIVFQNASVSTNLTSSNFLGFSNAAYTDGQTATIQIAGAVDDAQSGLTTASVHYVQTDGTLSTTAGTPSVEAGLALSATEIAIKA